MYKRKFYVGALSREQCEKAVVLAVTDSSTLTLVAGLKHDHAAYDGVTAVVGDLIRIWRAQNVDGQVPVLEAFSIYATRNINPENSLTFYTDSSGSADWWYRSTYFNASTMEGTDLDSSFPVRGDDLGHYATLDSIRREAGFTDAQNLSPVDVDAKRREAESEINASLGDRLTVPFVKPIPDIIETITIKLAAGLLVAWAYQREPSKETRVTEARAMIKEVASGSVTTGDDNVVASGVAGDFGDGPRMFSVGDRF